MGEDRPGDSNRGVMVGEYRGVSILRGMGEDYRGVSTARVMGGDRPGVYTLRVMGDDYRGVSTTRVMAGEGRPPTSSLGTCKSCDHPPFVNQSRCSLRGMPAGWVYIMSNRPNGTLYVGVTNDIRRRVAEHKSGAIQGFTRKYGLVCLVYAEQHANIVSAIQRETSIKHWPRAWKVRLIGHVNPEWDDLAETLPY